MMGGSTTGGSTAVNGTISVPRINLRNNTDTGTPTPLKLNNSRFRHIYYQQAEAPLVSGTDADYGKKLPWLSFYKRSDDLLQVRLSTTIAYRERLSGPGAGGYEAFTMSGFPLLLDGSSNQFQNTNNIDDDDWENDWPFYKQHSDHFGENFDVSGTSGLGNWYDNDTFESPMAITGMRRRKRLLVLDLSSNSNDTDNDGNAISNFVLKNTNGSVVYPFKSSLMGKVNRKDRPPYLVIRLDNAYEETTFSGLHTDGSTTTRKKGLVTTNPNFWRSISDNSTKSKLYVFNYVYYGYVISPYSFMANFTTDYLRGKFITSSGAPDSFFLHTNSESNIQVNSEFFSSTHELKTGWSDRGNNHFFINTPYYYDINLSPQLLNHDISQNSGLIDTSSTWSTRNNVMTDISFVTLSSAPDITAPYHIEQLFWFSLHSFRHTEYSAPNLDSSITKKLYLGNYLNVNEVGTSTTIDASGNPMYTNINADYMPKKTSTGFYACGSMISNYHPISGGTSPVYMEEEGTKNLHMPRKTMTQYFKIDYNDSSEYSKYSFNWNQSGSGWNDLTPPSQGITTDTSYVDVSNCEVLEWRNLVELDGNTIIELDIDINKYGNEPHRCFTFVTSRFTKTDQWKGGIKLENNDVVTRDTTSSGSADPRNIKNVEEEKFRITWGDSTSTNLVPANTSKHAYVIDIASGTTSVSTSSDMRMSVVAKNSSNPTDQFLPPSSSNYTFESNAQGAEYTLRGDVAMAESGYGVGGNWTVTVYRVGADSSNDWGTPSQLEYSKIQDRINFALDSEETAITININRKKNNDGYKPFGYLNFIGLTSSEFLGGINARDSNANSNIILSQMFKRRNVEGNSLRRALTIKPYFINSTTNESYWQDNSVTKIFYNPNLFYGRTNFKHSNIYGAAVSTFSDSQTDIFLKNGVSNPPTWRSGSHKNDGKEVTTFPQLVYVRPSGIDLFITSLTGKFDLDNRVLDGPIDEDDEPPTVELNDKITISEPAFGIVNQKFECLNFYNIMHTMSQKNLFISDYWQWDVFLNDMIAPPSVYTGEVPITINMPDKSINKRYNVYDYKASDVPSSIYTGTAIHTPDKAFENQCLISMIVEVSTISLNVSHILLNTWVGNKTEDNTFPMVGLSSFPNEQGEYYSIYGTPKLQIKGGNSITPTINESPVYLSINPKGHFNFATDSTPGVISDADKTLAPQEIKEAEAGPIDSAINFGSSSFVSGGTNGSGGYIGPIGGWITYNPFNTIPFPPTYPQGIFYNTSITSLGPNVYNTIDISTNALALSPTSINTTFNGKFTQEEQEFPLELFFTYPFTMNPAIPKPDKLTTSYLNSDGKTTNSTFKDYKGYKRFSSLYALEIVGTPEDYNNENFVAVPKDPIDPTVIPKGRKIFPNTVILNCVELPPPLQVNNFNDMLAGDNSFTRIVWKGYNFNYSSGGPRSQNGNSGNILWKIERFQTQLEIRKVVFEGTITPKGGENDNGYNLSIYEFIDTNVRIYDKYTYTVSGIYQYQFKRTRTDTKLYTLELDIGSFTTDEFIICKNNKFTYGRYNTGATNLKLFRPLLLNKPGGQVDEYGRPSAGGTCPPDTFAGSTRISSSQNIYANTSNQVTKKGTYVLLSKQQYRPFR